MSTEYEKTYDESWKEIIENEDGTLNLDQIKRELHDYWIVMGEVSEVYDDVTGGQVSKPNARASAVISAANESTQEWLDDRMAEWVKDIIEVFENADEDATPEEIREHLFDALGITEGPAA